MDGQRFDDWAGERSRRALAVMALVLAGLMVLWWPTDWWVFADAPDDRAAYARLRLGYIATCLFWAAAMWGVQGVRRWMPWAAAVMIVSYFPVTLWALGRGMARLDHPWFYASYILPFALTPVLVPLGRRLVATALVIVAWLGLARWWWGEPPQQPHWGTIIVYMLFCGAGASVIGDGIFRLTLQNWRNNRELDARRAELRVLTDELQARVDAQTAELRRLARHLQEQRERELVGLARDLHDEFGQLLTAMRFEVDLIAMRRPDDEGAARMNALLDQMLVSLRGALDELRPQILDHAGLAAALQWLARTADARSGVAVRYWGPEQVAVGGDVSLALFRIAQEALTNALRHGDPESVVVTLEQPGDGQLRLSVADDGSGIRGQARVGALGLVGMRERAMAAGSELQVDTGAGGTRVTVQVGQS